MDELDGLIHLNAVLSIQCEKNSFRIQRDGDYQFIKNPNAFYYNVFQFLFIVYLALFTQRLEWARFM